MMAFPNYTFEILSKRSTASVFPFVHSAYAAYKVSQGEDYRYPLVADLIENR
jgi:uncharacterized Tic20 family protein